MHRFNYFDYVQNPGKYQLFKTAVVARHTFTEDGEHDIAAGEVVGIQYMDRVWNAMYDHYEPVYTITTKDGQFWGHMYANALADFVL